ncbi:hypothetical protein E8E15_002424 [Penicillium rubens]|nr:hypothetical protein E8E15_002424 [Penicillium rubens]
MWRYDEPKPEQVNRNTQTSPGLSSRWGQIATDNKDMHDEIERLQRRVKTAEKKAEFFQQERLLVEEQGRRRGELLEDAVQESEVVRKENRILMAKIASLQAGVETFSDEQIKQEMCLLYHDIERWRFTHFVAKPNLQQRNDPTPRPDGLDISTLDIIQTHIAGLIYHLEKQCNWVIEKVESCFGRYAVTERPKRMQQLHDIIARCIKFKHKLDCQEDRYIFWGSYQYGLPFRDNRMRTLTEEDTSDGHVHTSLWPGLYKIIRTGEWSTVEKEIVKKIAPETPSVGMIDEMESREDVPELDEI